MMKVAMRLFLFSLLALVGVDADDNNTSLARGRRAQSVNAAMGLDYEDVPRHKRSKSSDDFSGDFQDNSLGYCVLSELSQLEELNLLLQTSFELVDLFLDIYTTDEGYYEEANSALKDFVALVRQYMSADNAKLFSDREILSILMEQNVRAPNHIVLTSECKEALEVAFVNSIVDFNMLMNVGESFEPPDAYLQGKRFPIPPETTDTYPVLLATLEQGLAGGDTFVTFFNFLYAYYAVFNPATYLNRDWLDATRSWQEMALSPVSIAAKLAAVALTGGEDIKYEFLVDALGPRLQQIYEDTVATCYAPTNMPSSAPSLTPASANGVLMVVAISDFVASTVTQATMDASWTAFRAAYPNRPFCLLQTRDKNADDLKVPTAFLNDGNTVYRKIARDMGSNFEKDDWYDLCNLYALEDAGVGKIPYFEDVNDSANDIPASKAYFLSQIASYGQTAVAVTSSPTADATNWIAPFQQDFL